MQYYCDEDAMLVVCTVYDTTDLSRIGSVCYCDKFSYKILMKDEI